VNFVMLNPSTADAEHDDPTVRKCISFARRWGFEKLIVTNLFALRSSTPERLYSHDSPIGPENNHYLVSIARLSDSVICAWGNHGALNGRHAFVRKLLEPKVLKCIHQNTAGQPAHPLYLSLAFEPKKWT
jgi:hypothetical protein